MDFQTLIQKENMGIYKKGKLEKFTERLVEGAYTGVTLFVLYILLTSLGSIVAPTITNGITETVNETITELIMYEKLEKYDPNNPSGTRAAHEQNKSLDDFWTKRTTNSSAPQLVQTPESEPSAFSLSDIAGLYSSIGMFKSQHEQNDTNMRLQEEFPAVFSQ